MKKNKKYDIIIYGCLIGAILCIVLGCGDYLLTLKEEGISFAVKDTTPKIDNTDYQVPEGNTGNSEPEELQKADRNAIVEKYLDSIIDQIVIDDLITYDMIKTWDEYEVINTTFEREIVESYYSYYVDIKISNKKATIPTEKNKKLSKDDYIVITLKVNIVDSTAKNGFVVKNIDIPVEN
mgnify:CR=1 FL=1